MRKVMVTGGAGFIGNALVRALRARDIEVVVLDALRYAGRREHLDGLGARLIHGDICETAVIDEAFAHAPFDTIFHLAAETHVDNSINGPDAFIMTNVVGTYRLLEGARRMRSADPSRSFKFVHISTDEVFGDLEPGEPPFDETTRYLPSSPYSASKAGSDHLARAWHRTYGLPTIVTNCTNNYGPRQHHEKLIPRMISCALAGKNLPVYGKGENIRDWIFVEDHVNGLIAAAEKGRIGETYCFGGEMELSNIQIVHTICEILDSLRPRPKGAYRELIEFVTDRPGHDFRYAISIAKARDELGYAPARGDFKDKLRGTIEWYLANPSALGT